MGCFVSLTNLWAQVASGAYWKEIRYEQFRSFIEKLSNKRDPRDNQEWPRDNACISAIHMDSKKSRISKEPTGNPMLPMPELSAPRTDSTEHEFTTISTTHGPSGKFKFRTPFLFWSRNTLVNNLNVPYLMFLRRIPDPSADSVVHP